jgi:hypothetical protein
LRDQLLINFIIENIILTDAMTTSKIKANFTSKKIKGYTTTIFISTNFFLIDAMATGKINANFTWKKLKDIQQLYFINFS